jgi:hypothetical protein
MRRSSRWILAFLIAALPAAAQRAVPLDCTTVMTAAPMTCAGPTCCCVAQGGCTCVQPASPAAPEAPAVPALASHGIELQVEVVELSYAPAATAVHAPRTVGVQSAPAMPILHLCVLQV